EKLNVAKRQDCQTCNGKYKFLSSPPAIQQLCSDAYHINIRTTNLKKLKIKIMRNPDFIVTGSDDYLGITYRKKGITLFKNRMIIKNVSSAAEAKTIASKIIGM
ncbi:hypothetical protein HYW99_03190, partial [Candidatus Woesearchaeota archaeon]|nr:hypothetical protein [Candidatus Woesearchaeota archaeon]